MAHAVSFGCAVANRPHLFCTLFASSRCFTVPSDRRVDPPHRARKMVAGASRFVDTSADRAAVARRPTPCGDGRQPADPGGRQLLGCAVASSPGQQAHPTTSSARSDLPSRATPPSKVMAWARIRGAERLSWLCGPLTLREREPGPGGLCCSARGHWCARRGRGGRQRPSRLAWPAPVDVCGHGGRQRPSRLPRRAPVDVCGHSGRQRPSRRPRAATSPTTASEPMHTESVVLAARAGSSSSAVSSRSCDSRRLSSLSRVGQLTAGPRPRAEAPPEPGQVPQRKPRRPRRPRGLPVERSQHPHQRLCSIWSLREV